MQDTWNPTDNEVTEWAFDCDSLVPEQDWDLALTGTSRAPLAREKGRELIFMVY